MLRSWSALGPVLPGLPWRTNSEGKGTRANGSTPPPPALHILDDLGNDPTPLDSSLQVETVTRLAGLCVK